MEASMRYSVYAAVLAAVLAVANAAPLAAQGDISFTSGSGVYASDEFCEDTDAFFSVLELSGSRDLFGGSVAYSNGAWPWSGCPEYPDCGAPSKETTDLDANKGSISLNRGLSVSRSRTSPDHEAFLTHGRAIRIVAEGFPVAILSRLIGEDAPVLHNINRYLRPSFGVGVHISGDGRVAPAGNGHDLPTFGLKGSTAPMLSYGARAYLPGRDKRIRLTAHYRGNTMFVREVAYRTPNGETLRRDGETLTWGEWGIGLSMRIGPSRRPQPTTLTAR